MELGWLGHGGRYGEAVLVDRAGTFTVTVDFKIFKEQFARC